jgi:hypothetical protein
VCRSTFSQVELGEAGLGKTVSTLTLGKLEKKRRGKERKGEERRNKKVTITVTITMGAQNLLCTA